MTPDNLDFEAAVKSRIDDFVIPKYRKKMPIRLLDTYTGLILEIDEIVSLMRMRSDYRRKVDDAVREAKQLATPVERKIPSPSQRPKLSHLDDFIAEYLAFAMFSHRWRGREPTLDDVKKASRGIYSMQNKDLVEEKSSFLQISQDVVPDYSTGVEKLQEFCCLAAKCGFRWAWADTCCINKKDYAETSESINSMFLWYNSSHLTIVYLDDVDDVKEGRLPAVNHSGQWFEDPEIINPFPSDPSKAQNPSDIYATTLQTRPFDSLHRYLRDKSLQSMRPDEQVEAPQLRTHLEGYFTGVQDDKARGQFRELPVWLRRGWTLQEMVASKRLRFYSKKWTLLEEADDPDTDEAEGKFSIPSFRYRARRFDHRANNIWQEALVKASGVHRDDLASFEIGTKDVGSRFLWAAKRTTTKDEDAAYCLLGIFDVSLPAMYGEGHRAFFRLQEELMKRTGDVSLFDWSGPSSSVNSFLARDAKCFEQYNIPRYDIPDSTESTIRMIVSLFCAIFKAPWRSLKTTVLEARDRIHDVVKSPPPGHTLVNGKLNISLFEHQVKRCQRLTDSISPLGDTYYNYKLEAEGLKPTEITFSSQAPNLADNPKQYYLCRPWHRQTQTVLEILLEFIGYLVKDTLNRLWGDDSESECEAPNLKVNEDEDKSESRLREEVQLKRKEVLEFFEYPFPVYLVHVKEEYRIRMGTAKRVAACYSKFDFTMPVVTRSIL